MIHGLYSHGSFEPIMRAFILRHTLTTVIGTSLCGFAVGAQELAYDDMHFPPVSVFASFPDERTTELCLALPDASPCIEDFITPRMFYETFSDKEVFARTAASEDGFDYEVLIANTLVPSVDTSNASTLEAQFDVTWRGIPLASYAFSKVMSGVTQSEEHSLAEYFTSQFLAQAHDENVFSADQLYMTLQASNYPRDLKIPEAIQAFELYDMQLYHDPLQGAVARYAHPQYPRDIIDVFVYPVFQVTSETNDTAQSELQRELEKEIDDIELIAKSRDIDNVTVGQIQQIDWQINTATYSGMFFDVQAEDEEGEPLFTTTYLFKSKDKFIKFSANFPGRIADTMVKDALPQIEVPDASHLMKNLRAPNDPQS